MSYNKRILQVAMIACLSGMVEGHDDMWGIRNGLRNAQKFWEYVDENLGDGAWSMAARTSESFAKASYLCAISTFSSLLASYNSDAATPDSWPLGLQFMPSGRCNS